MWWSSPPSHTSPVKTYPWIPLRKAKEKKSFCMIGVMLKNENSNYNYACGLVLMNKQLGQN